MLQDKNIALFVDVDNCGLQFEHYNNVIAQVNSFGQIITGKVYGLSDRKHKDIIAHANAQGYVTAMAMRVKKRNSKVFDNRIIVDVLETVLTNDKIEAVAIVCAPADMVYLYRNLKKYGVKIIACDNCDEESVAFIDEVIDLGKVEIIKLPKVKVAKPQPKIEEQKVEPVVEEQPIVEKEEPIADVDDILRAINVPAPKQEIVQEQPIVEEVNDEPEQEVSETIEYKPQDDGDVLKKIEQLRNGEHQSEDMDLVNQIKKILDEMHS